MIALVLAAGKGTRMNSSLHKTLHKVNGKAMIRRIYETLIKSETSKVIFIVGNKKEQIIDEFKKEYEDGLVEFIVQEEQLGTGHAVKICLNKIKEYNEDILVINGDMPLIKEKSIISLNEIFKKSDNKLMIVSTNLENPKGYGRVIKENTRLIAIKEETEASYEEKKINEINAGIYLFKLKELVENIELIKNDNNKKEYYLTDLIKIYNDKNILQGVYNIENSIEIMGVNSLYELYQVNKEYYKQINMKHLSNEVFFYDIENTYIDEEVEIGKNTIIYPNVHIKGYTKIGNECIIYSNTNITNSNIGDNVSIKESYVTDSTIENNVTIGPYANIRPNTYLTDSVHIGNFVEVKNSKIGYNSKCGHLSYIGDTTIGDKVNIGAGTITCNYDGIKKHKTTIGDNSFIGSNSIIVSPVNIGKNVVTAAGSVITKDVKDYSLAFGRSKQVTKEGYLKDKK